jgi:hypothetical protein
MESEAGLSSLGELAAYRQIQKAEPEHFDEPPVTTELYELRCSRTCE